MLLKCSYSACNNLGYSDDDDDAESICSLPIDEYEDSPNIGKFSVSINEYDSIRIELPNLLWNGYYNNIKSFFVSKSGDTVTLSGEWKKGRPFLCGGPLNGAYLFSEIHFHVPSEHLLNEKRYPMEMHVVHYKSNYLTEERALKEKDGTLVVVYLFEVGDTSETAISRITSILLKTKYLNVLPKAELNICNLAELVKHFYTNYFIYTGKGNTHDRTFELQWIISCQRFIISKEELNDMECCLQYGSTCELPKTVVKVKHLFLVGDTVVQDIMDMRKKSQIEFVQSKTKVSEKAKSCTNIKTEKRSECSCKKRKNLIAKETCTDQKSIFFGIDKITVCSENKYTQTSDTFLIACKSVQMSSDAKEYDGVDFTGERKNNEIIDKDCSELRKHENAEEKSNEMEAKKAKKTTSIEKVGKNIGQKRHEAVHTSSKSEGGMITFGKLVQKKSEKAGKAKKDKPSGVKNKYKAMKEKISEKIRKSRIKRDKETSNKAKTRIKNTKLKQEHKTEHDYGAEEEKEKPSEGSKAKNNKQIKKSKESNYDNDSGSDFECISSESSMNIGPKMKSVQCFASLTDYRQFPAETTKSRTSSPVYSSDSDLDTVTFDISDSESELKKNQIKLCSACTSTKSIPFPECEISDLSESMESVNTKVAILVNVFPNLNEEQNFDGGRQQQYDTMMLVLNHQMSASRIFYATCFSFVQVLARIEQEIEVDLTEHEIKFLENSAAHKTDKNHLQNCYSTEKCIEKTMKVPLDTHIKEKENESVSVTADSNNGQDFRRLPGKMTEEFHVNFSIIPPHLTNSLRSIDLIIDSEIPETEKIHRQEDLNESIKSRRSTDTRRSDDDEVFIDTNRTMEAEIKNREKQEVFTKSELTEITNGSRADIIRFGNVKEMTSKIPIVSEKAQVIYYPAELEKYIVTDNQKKVGQQNAKRKGKNRNGCYSGNASKHSYSNNLLQFKEPEDSTESEDDRNIIIQKQVNEIKGIGHKHWSLINLPTLDGAKEIGRANESAFSLSLPTGNKGKRENQSESTAAQNLAVPKRQETVKSANVIPGSSLKLRFLPKGSSFLRDINVEVEDCLVQFDSKESIDQIFIEARLLIEQREKDKKVVLTEGNESNASQSVLSERDRKSDILLPSLSFSLHKILESCDRGKNIEKSESVINSNRPMYFISDRLETDPVTGKKIFIGSFT